MFSNLFKRYKKKNESSPLDQHPHLSGLKERELDLLKEIVEIQKLPAGKVIFTEDDLSDEIYFLVSGRVRIEKQDHAQGLQVMGELTSGSVFGEMAFLDPSPRSATAITVEGSRLGVLSKDKLLSSGQIGLDIYHQLVKNIARVCVTRLRKTSDEYAETLRVENEQLQLQTEFGKFFIAVILSFGLAAVFDQLVFDYSLANRDSSLFNWAYLLVLLIPAIYLIKKFDYPLKMFGVTLNHWKSSLIEGSIIAFLLSLVFYLSLFAYTQVHPIKPHVPQYFILFVVLYFFHVYIQEFITRGVVQTSLQRFLNDQKGFLSVAIASCLFAFFHLHKGLMSSGVVFLASLFFGWIYLRHKNLIGVTMIHFCLGLIAFYFGVIL